jgi:DNA polymerase
LHLNELVSAADDAAKLRAARKRAAVCQRCDLWKRATQTVFGDGPARARIMLVGEQPGDVEDREGEPFVGPAGQLLRHALEDAGIDIRNVYLTNAVKHFKWTERGKRRIHERPNYEEIMACRMWLEEEIAAIRPKAIIALGATAATTLYGSSVRVMRDRAKPIESPWAPVASVTVHPSSILRVPDAEARRAARKAFIADLKAIVARVKP